jgi:hypothetical protein
MMRLSLADPLPRRHGARKWTNAFNGLPPAAGVSTGAGWRIMPTRHDREPHHNLARYVPPVKRVIAIGAATMSASS